MADQRDIDGVVMLLWKVRNCTLEQQAEAIFAWLEGDGWERLGRWTDAPPRLPHPRPRLEAPLESPGLQPMRARRAPRVNEG
jgi:hypothetical protein